MNQIYEEAMEKDFDCLPAKTSDGLMVFMSRDGKPFPTYWQFHYRVYEAIGKEIVQKTLYGEVRHRTKIAASKGRFSEEVANLMERVEVDGYYVKERPRGYIEGSALRPLCVVVARDVLCGKKLGIGFSLGKETGDAYRMLLFCMAVPKEYFCRLFGVPLRPGEWVNEGLPGHFSLDRGPGARRDLAQRIEDRFPIRDMAPSWSGQSKATVESSHPKDLKFEGEPTYIQSDFTPVELAKREIFRLISFNNTANMEDRFDPDSELAYVIPSPNGLWQHYDKLYRNDAIPMSIDDAVRAFLSPIEFSLKEDGAYFKGRRFYSKELRDLGVLDRRVETRVSGYTLDLCTRYVWVEVEGRLLQIPAMLRTRGDEATLYTSVDELDQWDGVRDMVQSAFGVHKNAASADIKMRFKEETGKDFDAGKRRSGKPKRDAVARQEENDAMHSGSKRRAA